MPISLEIHFCGLLLFLLSTPVVCAEKKTPLVYNDWGSLAQELMPIDESEQKKFDEGAREGLLEMSPVVLPEGKNLLTHNRHFGWPIATLAKDGTMVVVFYRQHAHTRQEFHDKFKSPAVVVRSADGGKTWSPPLDLKQFAVARTGSKAGFGNSICTASDGSIHLLTGIGSFRSVDNGVSWKSFPDAYTDKQLSGARTNHGPRLIEHPKYGLMAFGHETKDFPSDSLWIRYSQDGGATWQEMSQQFDEPLSPIEPTALMHNGALIILARCHGSLDESTRSWRYVQFVSRNGELPLAGKYSNIPTSDLRKLDPPPGHTRRTLYNIGPWSQDTTDLIYNPVSKRIEAVVTNRTGGPPGHLGDHNHITLNLWSIDPEELIGGSSEWKYECNLLRRYGTFITPGLPILGSFYDGLHPGATIVDKEKSVQHIFIYSGYTKGGSGIYRITRSLDTKRLVSWITTKHPYALQEKTKLKN